MKWKSKLSTGAMLVAALGLYTGSAQAASISDLIRAGEGNAGENTLVDDNREYLIDNVQLDNVVGQIDVGDSLRGHAIWTKLNGSPLGNQTLNNEFTSVFQVMVTDKVEVRPGEYRFTYGPDPSFSEAAALGLDGSAMMIFYEDASPDAALDYDDPTAPLGVNLPDDGTTFTPGSEDVGSGHYAHEEAFIQTAADGEYFWALGFTGAEVDGVATAAEGEGWISDDAHTDNMFDFFDVDSGNDLASSNFSLNRTLTDGRVGTGENLTLRDRESFVDSSFSVEFNGSSTMEGVRNELTAFEASSQSTLTFAAIPLPPAIWMGIVMLSGLGGIRYLNQRQQGGELEMS